MNLTTSYAKIPPKKAAIGEIHVVANLATLRRTGSSISGTDYSDLAFFFLLNSLANLI